MYVKAAGSKQPAIEASPARFLLSTNLGGMAPSCVNSYFSNRFNFTTIKHNTTNKIYKAQEKMLCRWFEDSALSKILFYILEDLIVDFS